MGGPAAESQIIECERLSVLPYAWATQRLVEE